MAGTLRRGLIAGAVGTLVTDLVTYADMAVRGRPASALPGDVVSSGLDRLGWSVPGRGALREHRTTALGALAGIVNGIATGAGVSCVRSLGFRLSGISGPLVTGAVSMAASDVPATLLGVTDPRRWSAQDWAADIAPHLAYGAAVHATLRTMERHGEGPRRVRRPSSGLLARCFALGLASGSRSSLGLVGAAFGGPSRSRLVQAGAAAAAAAELVADKQPQMPSRLDVFGLVPRFAGAVAGAGALAGREDALADLPALFAAAGAAAGAFAGAAWRDAGLLPDRRAAVAEDAVAVALTSWAVH